MSFCVLILSLLFSMSARAEESPILSQKAIFQTNFLLPRSSLDTELVSVGKRLEAKSVFWFGYPWAPLNQLGVFCSGQTCQVQVVFTANEFEQKDTIMAELKGINANIVSFVTNERGTFAGISAVVYSSGGGAASCQPKALRSVNAWRDSLEDLAAVAGKFRQLDRPLKLGWIQENLDCDSPLDSSKANAIKLHIDLTNAVECPLTSDTLKTCFLGRGLSDEEIPF